MRYLRTNTDVIITVGPFYDKTDGVTIETGLTITNERITFVVDLDNGSAPTLVLDNVTGATSGTGNDLNYIANCDAGLMQMELAAANVNYLGRAFLTITDAANHVPVFHEFTILPAMVYDSLILGTDVLQADMTQILGTAVSAPATAGILDVNLKNIANAAVSTSTAQLGVNVVQISADGTAADNAELFFDGTGYAGGTVKLGVDVVAISGDATAADNEEKFFDGTGYAGTNNTIPTVTTTGTATNLTNLPAAAATAAELAKVPKSDSTVVWNATALAAINAEVDSALNTAIPGSPTADSINERVATMDTTIAIMRLLIATGAVVDDNDPDPTATAFETNLTEASNDHYNGAFLVFTSGALLDQSRKITGYVGATKVITTSAFTEAPAGGDTFSILGRSE